MKNATGVHTPTEEERMEAFTNRTAGIMEIIGTIAMMALVAAMALVGCIVFD